MVQSSQVTERNVTVSVGHEVAAGIVDVKKSDGKEGIAWLSYYCPTKSAWNRVERR